ncbi:hypothetical protein HWV62_3032 [Athelia sp. TMB]|nr:hypothetical protein HWV62_3032 [Athelia sp. TMB]
MATQDDDKKDASRKKTKSAGKAKKVSEAGVWPCKINGCNKQFAREADLKRHQRTTKSHSMPGFIGSACPQCDATFTRTDALRRHQKSRHNGVIIEPIETNKGEDGEDAGSSGSKNGSRATSPSGKGKGKRAKKLDPDAIPAALANPGTAGPSSYYRQHTMQNVFSAEGVIMDPAQQFGPTRLHQASWPPPPPWAAGGDQAQAQAQAQAQMGTISYHPQQPGYYQPSPYYRSPGPPMGGAPVMQQAFAAQPQQPQDIQQQQQQQPQHSQGVDGEQELGDEDAQGDVEMDENVSPGPVIDPSLDASASTPNPQGNGAPSTQISPPSKKPVSLEITQAAMQAVLQSSRASATPDQGAQSNSSSANGHLNAQSTNPAQESYAEPRPITTAKSPFAHHSPVTQSQALPQGPHIPTAQSSQAAMEPILTEDGEPMLSPEELLTQVGPILNGSNEMGAILDMLLQDSLASPPPS